MSSFSITFILVCLSCLFHNVVCDRVLYSGLGGGIGGLIILILDIIAIFYILQSGRDLIGKLLWILLIIFFPIGGLIIWLLCGRGSHVVA